MAKGRQPPKAPPKKTTQGYRTPEEAYRAADEAIARSQASQKIWEEYEARSREISQQAARRASHITTALAAGLGGLAIYEVGRHTYQNIQRKQAAAQRAERDHRVARARGLRDLTQAQQAEEVATARRMHRIPTPLSLFDIREPYTREEILTAVATRERPQLREAATLLLNSQEL